MKVLSLALLAVAPTASAFAPSSTTTTQQVVSQSPRTQLNAENNVVNRRSIFGTITASTIAIITSSTTNPSPANAGLLDDYGSDPTKIDNKPKEEPVKPAIAKPKDESVIEPNLRSNYYYPTNKKRYLPRIKKCNDAIPEVALAIGDLDWEAVSDFNSKVADDTILPMKLYTSSLSGGGTNVKVSFTKDMMKAADDFESSQKALSKAVKKKDQTASSRALEDMATALMAYRTSGRLLGPDGGGDIPSVDEIRRSACRVQGRTFEKKISARDARLEVDASVSE